MALTKEQAVELANATLTASHWTRVAYEAKCAVDLTYTYGNGWTRVAPVSTSSAGGLARLKVQMTDLDREIRFHIPKIRPRVNKLNSMLMPRELDYTVQPATGAINDFMASLVGRDRLKMFCTGVNALRRLKQSCLWRTVLGSVVVRRTIATEGEAVTLRDVAGDPILDAIGNAKTIRNFTFGWGVCPPFEIVRDPSARTHDFDDEEIIGHEKPRAVTWVARNFPGLPTIETETTLGKLLEFQRYTAQATGQGYGTDFSQSKQRAVMFSEWWFKDPSDNRRGSWPYYLIAYRLTDGSDGGLHSLLFGKNPFGTLPLHHYWYDMKLMSPWGAGVAEQCIPLQDATNLAITAMLRLMLHNMPRTVIEAGSIEGKLEEAMKPRADLPIVVKRNTGFKPTRLQPSNPDPTVLTTLSAVDNWHDTALNMSPIQSGFSSPRGESAAMGRLKREQADTPLTAILDFDELTTNELLTGTLFDIARMESMSAMRTKLGRYPDAYIAALKGQDPAETLAGVLITPDSLRPQTPGEMQDDYYRAINGRLIDPETARFAMYLRNGIITDPREAAGLDNQKVEIGKILAGQKVPVRGGQPHRAHKYVLDLEKESPQWDSYTDQQKDDLQQHWWEHDQGETIDAARAMQRQAQAQGQAQASPQPQQPTADYEITPQGPDAQGLPQLPPPPQNPTEYGEMVSPQQQSGPPEAAFAGPPMQA